MFRWCRRPPRCRRPNNAAPRTVATGGMVRRSPFFVRGMFQDPRARCASRSEEHTSELQSLMRNSYAVFGLKKKKRKRNCKQKKQTPKHNQKTKKRHHTMYLQKDS